MTVGSIVLATDQGLGYLAKDFYDHGVVQKVVIRPHSNRESHKDWYRPEDILKDSSDLLDQCDVLLFFEEVWDWKLIVQARERGIKTVLMPMYECTRNPMPYEPELILCPSLLDLETYKDKNAIFLPVPTEVEWKKRDRARVFVHNAGNGGLGGRNGTKELLEALPLVKSPIKLIVRSQVSSPELTRLKLNNKDPRLEVQVRQARREELFAEGDVFIFPEKFNGLSLPLQEAYASGMLVMAGNRFPVNRWLPNEPLISVDHYTRERIAVEFANAIYTGATIASTIDQWYDRDISEFSMKGRAWAETNSWHNLKEKYMALLSQ